MTNEFEYELFCDGGLIVAPGQKPGKSPLGGTYAWVRTQNGVVVDQESGVVSPADIGAAEVSNNNAELFALLHGLYNLPTGWKGRINADSQIALGWVFSAWKQDTIPDFLREWLNETREKTTFLSGLQWRLLQGHPTKADLACGIGKKRNLPVSEFNVLCDDLCNQEARKFLEAMKEKAA